MKLWDMLVGLVEVLRASGVFRMLNGSFWNLEKLQKIAAVQFWFPSSSSRRGAGAGGGLMLRVREGSPAFAKLGGLIPSHSR